MPLIILFLLIIIGVILYTYAFKGKDSKPAPRTSSSDDAADDPFNVVYFNEIKEAQAAKEEIPSEEAEVIDIDETEE